MLIPLTLPPPEFASELWIPHPPSSLLVKMAENGSQKYLHEYLFTTVSLSFLPVMVCPRKLRH